MVRVALFALVLLCSAGVAAGAEPPMPPDPQLPPPPPPAGASERIALVPDLTDAARWEKAQVDGKYRILLRQLLTPDDVERYGAFRDWGPWSGSKYLEHEDLPSAHWVYVAPYWYLWRDVTAKVDETPAWAPDQASGAPDTFQAGDLETAWAPQELDAGEEWIVAEWRTPRRPVAILVHETFNPGALIRVTVIGLDGKEIVVWEGKDPARGDRDLVVLPVRVDAPIARLKLTLDTSTVEGWNEIDAIGILDDLGATHWADGAHASSYYGEPDPVLAKPSPAWIPTVRQPTEPSPDALKLKVRELEREVERLRAAIRKLRDPIRD
jgi:hypothetical protein